MDGGGFRATAHPSRPAPFARAPQDDAESQASCKAIIKRIKISLYRCVNGTRLMAGSSQLPFAALNGALKAAGEETRLRIVTLLAEAELTVSDLTDILRQSQPRISRHLRLLAEAGLVA